MVHLSLGLPQYNWGCTVRAGVRGRLLICNLPQFFILTVWYGYLISVLSVYTKKEFTLAA